ncbi:hypothetical protein PWT90_07142 [Aphanocladium album]|nr:hypothetical protein PWT90_07142 [Aphanocladium album]
MATTKTTSSPAPCRDGLDVLKLASPNGIVTKPLLPHPPRDARPGEIPIIDISAIFGSDFAERQEVASQIRKAATSNGVFYISNHGMPEQVIGDVYKSALDFFRQDLETKLKARSPNTDSFVGYFPPLSMKINPFEGKDLKEIFISRYDPSLDESVASPDDIPETARKHFHYKDTPWEATNTVPEFKPALNRYLQAGLRLTRALMRSIALSLSLPEDYFDEKMRYPNLLTNVNYYPAMKEARNVAGAQVPGFGSHTDFQIITVLWQDSVGGLQVLNNEGEWIHAIPIEGTLIVNVADLLQRITNDVYVSTVHRATNTTAKERISITLPTSFGGHETAQVVETCFGPDGSKKYEDLTIEQWSTKRLEAMIRIETQSHTA